jgi:hypothetical protein
VQAFSSLAGGGVNYFDLKFLEATSNNVQLFHTVGHTDPICAYTGVPAGCWHLGDEPDDDADAGDGAGPGAGNVRALHRGPRCRMVRKAAPQQGRLEDA